MEFVQFHPTVLYIAGGARFLISEAVRGEGAYLRDCHGTRFMLDDPDARGAAELAPRDVVARAITAQMSKTHHPCVYLDLTHLDPSVIANRFPHISDVCAEFGLDLRTDLVPVRPGAHYMIGGVTVNESGQTTLPNLWAAGEVSSTGLHGANRLGSNSLLEGLVYGIHCGQGASRTALEMPDNFSVPPVSAGWDRPARPDDLDLVDLRNSLTSLMWRNAGIQRDAAGLEQALRQVDFWNRYVATREFHDTAGWELQNMLLVARLVVDAASQRTESRGVHFRQDHPAPNPDQARHITLTAG
jgi:L-aspartate oxidase